MIALAELKKLPIEERLQLVEELWDSIAEERAALPDLPEVLEELERRDALFQADPSSAIPWEVVKEQLRSSRA